MLSVFKLQSALSEAATGAVTTDVQAYQFVGDLDESTFAEANHNIITEALSYTEFSNISDELMVEAAMSGDETRIGVLSENVLKNLWAKVVEFFKRLVASIKGVIEKLKAYFLKFTGKTNKWASVMEKYIKEAANKKGANAVVVSYRDFDVKFITETMPAATMLGDIDKEFSKDNVTSMIQSIVNDTESLKGKGPQDSEVQSFISSMEKDMENGKRDWEDYEKGLVPAFAKALGITSAIPDNQTLWREADKKATGGPAVDHTISDTDANNLLQVVKNSSKTITEIKKHYDDQLARVTKTLNSLSGAESKAKFDDSVPANAKSAATAAIKAVLDIMVSGTKIIQSIGNTARSKNLAYLNAMASDYMNALTKYSNFRGKKD